MKGNKNPKVRKSKLEAPHIKKRVVRELAAGESQQAIAERNGVTQPTLCKFANKAEIKTMVEAEQRRLAECVPDAVQNFIEIVREMPEIPKEEVRRRELSLDASKDVLKSFGLLPSPVQSQINIYQDNRTQILSPQIAELLSRLFQPGEAVDAPAQEMEEIIVDAL